MWIGFWEVNALHELDKHLLYSLLYSSKKLFQQRVDEEGCGPLIGALDFEMLKFVESFNV